jgi:hypothetical protein
MSVNCAAGSSPLVTSNQNPFQHTASLSGSPTWQAAAVSTRADLASNPVRVCDRSWSLSTTASAKGSPASTVRSASSSASIRLRRCSRPSPFLS